MDCCGPAGPPPRCADTTPESTAAARNAKENLRHENVFMAVNDTPAREARGARRERRYGTVKPLNTQVAPAVKPKLGSSDVTPSRMPASRRTVPRVKRPPTRKIERLSVPSGGVPLRVLT